jgi:protein-L-isoaspartate(D-aspartate) O-methyltransferase
MVDAINAWMKTWRRRAAGMAYLEFLRTLREDERDYVARSWRQQGRVRRSPKILRGVLGRRPNAGYGGYRYDGRWLAVARWASTTAAPGRRSWIGLRKGFCSSNSRAPSRSARGLDISRYALEHAKPEIKARLLRGSATRLPFPDHSFDLVVSINTLHNLYLPDLDEALREIERVGRRHKYIVMDSYRNEQEKVNLMYWQLTCECFFTPPEWDFVLERAGYTGDYGCIYFD